MSNAPSSGRVGPRTRSWLTVGLEAFLLSIGVFLGLLGDQWREASDRRQLADDALRRLRSEIVSNRESVARVSDYHVELKRAIDRYFAADRQDRAGIGVRMQGLRPAFFEHSAWDLSLATQGLADIDQDLAFSLSRIYTAQETYERLTDGVTQALYLLPTDGPDRLLGAASIYFGDVVLMEPRLLVLYDSILPDIDGALSDRDGVD